MTEFVLLMEIPRTQHFLSNSLRLSPNVHPNALLPNKTWLALQLVPHAETVLLHLPPLSLHSSAELLIRSEWELFHKQMQISVAHMLVFQSEKEIVTFYRNLCLKFEVQNPKCITNSIKIAILRRSISNGFGRFVSFPCSSRIHCILSIWCSQYRTCCWTRCQHQGCMLHQIFTTCNDSRYFDFFNKRLKYVFSV